MWAVMMVGMMVPSAAPAVLLYASLARRTRERGGPFPGVWVFALGYLAAWTGFGALATGRAEKRGPAGQQTDGKRPKTGHGTMRV